MTLPEAMLQMGYTLFHTSDGKKGFAKSVVFGKYQAVITPESGIAIKCWQQEVVCRFYEGKTLLKQEFFDSVISAIGCVSCTTCGDDLRRP